jgi:adenylylsulfate kinase-like enzyme
VLEKVRKEEEKKPKRLGSVQPNFSSVWHTGLSGGAPDNVRCVRLVSDESAALGNRRRRTAKNHRTVRWCTGLSGDQRSPALMVGERELGLHLFPN